MTHHALMITSLNKSYKNGVLALKDVSLTVKKGDFIALLGANGAGKSTMISIIASLVNKSSGKVSVFGHCIDTERELAKHCIGLVPQEFNFSQFETCQQIIVTQAGYYGIPRKEAIQETHKVLKQLALFEKKDAQARTLSGGMKRRLMIARALIHQPKLLILDEPTAGVDIEIRRTMWEFLTKLNSEGTTILLTTHYLEEAEQLCNNVVILKKGHIIENTSIENLISRLNVETFIFDLNKMPETLPILDDIHFRSIDETKIECDLPKHKSLNEIFIWFIEHNIQVTSMRNKANRLEELFVQLTEKE
jgi:ABC-2 type transport system ATP-binding protein